MLAKKAFEQVVASLKTFHQQANWLANILIFTSHLVNEDIQGQASRVLVENISDITVSMSKLGTPTLNFSRVTTQQYKMLSVATIASSSH